MTLVREAVLGALRASGLMALWRRKQRASVGVLMLHGVMDGEDRPGWRPLRERVSRRTLAGYLARLARHYRFVSLSDAVEAIAGRRPAQPHSLVLTFDDGYRNTLTHALPVLRRFSAPLAAFLPTGMIERRSLFGFDRIDYALQAIPGDAVAVEVAGTRVTLALRPREALVASFSRLRAVMKDRLGADMESGPGMAALIEQCERLAGRSLEEVKERDDWSALLTWDETQRLACEAGVEVGSHSVDHTRLGLAAPETVRRELRESRAEIERRTGRPCLHLAYPNGSWTRGVAAVASEEGFVSALTCEEGVNPAGQDLMSLRRVGVPAETGASDLLARVSGLSEALSAVKARFGGQAGRADAAGPARSGRA